MFHHSLSGSVYRPFVFVGNSRTRRKPEYIKPATRNFTATNQKINARCSPRTPSLRFKRLLGRVSGECIGLSPAPVGIHHGRQIESASSTYASSTRLCFLLFLNITSEWYFCATNCGNLQVALCWCHESRFFCPANISITEVKRRINISRKLKRTVLTYVFKRGTSTGYSGSIFSCLDCLLCKRAFFLGTKFYYFPCDEKFRHATYRVTNFNVMLLFFVVYYAGMALVEIWRHISEYFFLLLLPK